MANPLTFAKNFADGFIHAGKVVGEDQIKGGRGLLTRARTGILASAAFKTNGSAPYVWAQGSTIGGYGTEYDYGTAGANQNIRWDKWGAALATVVSEPLFRCVEKRSTTVGSTPWSIIDNRTEDVITTSKDIDSDNALARALFRFQRRRDNEGAETLFTQWERARCIAGEVFIELILTDEADSRGQHYPADVQWLNPLAVWINAPLGRVQYFQYNAHGRSVIFAPDELVYHRLAMDMRTDVFGYSPVMASIGSGTLNILRNSSRTLEAFFGNDATPRNVVTPSGDFAASGWSGEQISFIQQTLARIKGTAAKYNTTVFPYPINFDQFELPDLDKWAKMLQDIEPRAYTVMGVPRSVAGDSDSTRYQASPDDIPNFNATVLTELDSIESVVNARIVPFFTQSDTPPYRFAFDRRQYEVIDPSLVQTYGQLFRDGAISLNEYRAKGGLEELDNGDLFFLNSNTVAVPLTELGKIQPRETYLPYGNAQTPPLEAGAMAEDAGYDTPQPDPETVAEQPNDNAYRARSAGKSATDEETPSYCVLAVVDAHPELIRIQDMLRGQLQDDAEYSDPDTFHITMVYVTGGRGAALADYMPKEKPSFAVVVDGIGVFDTPDGYAVYANVRNQGDIQSLQRAIASAATQNGWDVSDYSRPDAYQPHITLCYSTKPVKPFAIKPFSLIVSRIDLTDDTHTPVVSLQLKSAYAELEVWRRYALKHGATKARLFEVNTLPSGTASAVRAGLAELTDASKDEIATFFEVIRDHYNGDG